MTVGSDAPLPLAQEVRWIATTKTKVTRIPFASNVWNGAVEKNEKKAISVVIPVPAVPPSYLQNCNIIDLNYFLRVRCRSPATCQ